MTYDRLKGSAALGALAIALLAAALPAQAQERGERGNRGGWSQREDAAPSRRGGDRGDWRQQSEARAERAARPAARIDMRPARNESAPRPARVAAPRDYGAQATGARTYGADRQRGSYGATTRAEARQDWRQNNQQDIRQENREDRRESRQDYRQGYRAGQQADGRSDGPTFRQGYRAGQQQERREDWRDDRRDRQRAYAQGYRAGDRADGRYGNTYRRWDNRGWRNDNRYDWYRYRAANRSLYSPGRYYAPYRNYSYSRISIGFRLGSLFYSNRYWIDDPWRYRLPAVYGPYRWVRYYDDAMLVDIYSGEVVDVIYDFFW